MLANTITLADAVPANHVFDLVSRLGMESIRRETGVVSAEERALTIKNTVPLNNPTAKNRHLVQFTGYEVDATSGELYPYSVHAVISRHKAVTDGTVLQKCFLLGTFLRDATIMDDILIGGN